LSGGWKPPNLHAGSVRYKHFAFAVSGVETCGNNRIAIVEVKAQIQRVLADHRHVSKPRHTPSVVAHASSVQVKKLPASSSEKASHTRQPQTLLKHSAPVKQSIVTLDLEGVLVPEIWIAVAEKTGIKELRRTTRDEPNYDVLMKGRLKILADNNLKLSDIQEVIGTLRPLDGAKEFLDELRSITQVIILSDTFEEFARPLMKQLNWPTLLCHKLVIENDRVVDYKIRTPEQKQKAVAALKLLNYNVISAGDSFNDTAMLIEANVGFLFHAPENIRKQFPQFKAIEEYSDLLNSIKAELTR
jgi:phosphoserine/homoserine phosphotransferase